MRRWRFVSNQNSTIVGINDAGIETFTANMTRSLVREMIQNSLDACIPESREPVQVDFFHFLMDRNNVPDVDNLQEIIKKCRDSNSGEPDAYKFFGSADEILSKDKLDVLRVSDHNTVGLAGSDTCEKGTNWSRLVKESGSSNKGQSSGGSFGIGKSAAFACSDLRTVFYSSIDEKQIESNIGVAKLVSYQDEELGWTTGVGFYSEDEKFIAIPELAKYDSDYVRTDSGTDIYILGMHQVQDLKTVLIESVLLDFLVAIVKEKLIVNIQGDIIDKKTLPRYMSALNPYDNEDIKSLLNYYHLLTSPDPTIIKIPLDSNVYGKKYGFSDGDCTLYLKEGEGYNRKILMTRKAGMRILEQNRINGSIEFTGILIIDGPKMNETFKTMEVPSHDAWEPGRCRGEERYYSNILADLRKYLRNSVKEKFGKMDSDSMDAIGASDFLPDNIREEQQGMQTDEFSTHIKELKGRIVKPTRKRSEPINLTDISMEEQTTGGDTDTGSNQKSVTGQRHTHEENPVSESGKAEDKSNYAAVDVKKRLFCTDATKGKYILNFVVPSTADKGKLVILLSGEQSDFKLPVKYAEIMTEVSNTYITAIKDNVIYLKNMVMGDSLKLIINVEFDEHCMMEVDYYATKK